MKKGRGRGHGCGTYSDNDNEEELKRPFDKSKVKCYHYKIF